MKVLTRFIFILGFVALFALIVAYARGYRLDYKKKSLTPTGIMAISSFPKIAKIYIDGIFKGATDTNLTLPPGNYQVDVKKDGYTSISKKITLKGELVATIDALLFPLNPALSPMTNLGIAKAFPITEIDKVIIFVNQSPETEETEKSGIYLYEGSRKPLPFSPPLKTIALKSNFTADVDFSTAVTDISPDMKEMIVEFGEKPKQTAYLLSLENENKTPFDVTFSKDTLIAAWKEKKEKNFLKVLESFPDFAKIASESVNIISFSPDETKILYQVEEVFTLPPIITPPLIAANQTEEKRTVEKNNIYVYDKKEDKNYEIASTPEEKDKNERLMQWYFDSKHIFINEGKKIVSIDFDGGNRQTVYSGPYESDFFNTTQTGDLIILANLNPEANKLPDLYLVGIR